MSAAIVDITRENAKEYLIDESFNRPVVVDFWASWCEPCKNLMPVLEKLADEYAGQFLLAKVDADEQQMIAGQFGVRSLPTVMLIKDGQPIDGFAGAKPEQEIRTMLDQHLPKPWDMQLQKARGHIEEKAFDEAHALLREAYPASGGQADIAITLADVLTELKRYDEAEKILSEIKMADQDQDYQRVLAKLELAREAQRAPELQALEDQWREQPEDTEIAYQLALQYNQHEFRKEALTLLFELISKDINFKSGEAKKVYLDIIAVLGKGDPIAATFQRKLYTLLH